ncbi:MAG: DUF58 domain-containing protein [Deltaproteobacteria bacterium]|nr:DUF58 domain-containing protein [Deltaproteobacteria bacterium]
MLPAELLKKIKRIQLKTNYLANEVFSGEYESAFRGRGMEFEEVREYHPGDDVRSIDWNVTARVGEPHVKVFREEREMTVMVMVDLSASLNFGTHERLKNETAAEVAAVLAYAAVKSNDKVGLILFSDRVEKYIPPKKGTAHIYRIIQEILTYRAQFERTCIRFPLEYLMHVRQRHSICFLISDFLDQGYETALNIASRRHDMLCIQLYDRAEEQLPAMGYLKMRDPESGEECWINSSRASFQKGFQEQAKSFQEETQNKFRKIGVDSVLIEQSGDYVEPLLQFFREREKRQ